MISFEADKEIFQIRKLNEISFLLEKPGTPQQ